MEHVSSTTIPVAPDRLYSALADVGNLARFIPPLKSVRRTDPDLAHVVALQTCRSNDPMRWAKRFLKEQRQRAT